MTLENLLTLSDYLTIANLEKAYYDVIKKVRLPLSFVPVILNGAVVEYDEFTDLAEHNDVGIAIKEIVKIYGVDILDSDGIVDYTGAGTPGDFIIGTPCTEFQGFTETQFDNANKTDITEDRDLTPEIYQENRLLVCTNYDDYHASSTPFFWMFCYIYPYFCTTSTGILENRYDISGIATISRASYAVDTMLMYPVISKAIAYYMQDEGALVEATAYDNAAIQYIQMFNQNLDIPFGSPFQKIGDIDGNVI